MFKKRNPQFNTFCITVTTFHLFLTDNSPAWEVLLSLLLLYLVKCYVKRMLTLCEALVEWVWVNKTLERFWPSNYFQSMINAVSIEVVVCSPILSTKLVVLVKGKPKKPSTSQFFSFSLCNPAKDKRCKAISCILKFHFREWMWINQIIEKKQIYFAYNFSETRQKSCIKDKPLQN